MFCSSIRKRPEWAPAVRTLANSIPKLKGRLVTHDIALPLGQQGGGRVLRLVLLSPGDVGIQVTEERLDRLSHLKGGRDAAVIFLVDPQGRDADPMEAFMKLQIDIQNKFDLPLIPLSSASELPKTLAVLRISHTTAQPAAKVSPASLLQQMVSDGSPLSEHKANLLSEVGCSPVEVATVAKTNQGKARIIELLGLEDGTRVLSFLVHEELI